MATEADKQFKWEGKISANLKPTVEKVWPLLEDFCNVHKFLSILDTCHKAEGVEGVIRYCRFSAPLPSDNGDGALKWCHEKLVGIDQDGKWFSYEMKDNNIGFKAYKATVKIVPINGGDDPSGSQNEWSFVLDPLEGLGCADFCAFMDSNLQDMVKNIEKALEVSA